MRLGKLITVVVVLLALANPSSAAQGGELVLSGTGSASAEFVVRKPGTVDLQGLLPDATASFSGVVLRDERGMRLGLVIKVRRWASAAGGPEPISTRLDPLRLAPGRYRVELLASGPATVRVPATGGAIRRLTAKGPPRSRVTLTDLLASGLPKPEQRHTGVRVAPGSAAVLAFFVRTRAHQASVPQLCFPEPGAPTCTGAYGNTIAALSPGGVGDGWASRFSAIYGGQGHDGPHDALLHDVTVDLPEVLDALLVETDPGLTR